MPFQALSPQEVRKRHSGRGLYFLDILASRHLFRKREHHIRISWFRKVNVKSLRHIGSKFFHSLTLSLASLQLHAFGPKSTAWIFVNFKVVKHIYSFSVFSSACSRPFFSSLCIGIV